MKTFVAALSLPAITIAAMSRGGTCTLKPGAPSAYQPLCASEKTEAACATVSQTCVWAAAPTPAPAKPTPAPTPCGTPSGRPCAPAFNPLDLTGLWMMADTGPASQGMLWAQQAKPPSCFAGACSGATYTFTCLTGNYSAGSPFSTGDGCPWSTVACAVNADEEPYPGDYVSCLFGGATGGTDVISVLLDGGTLLGAHPDFPGSGVGWRRLTGKMTGLWSAVDDNATKTTAVFAVGHRWADNSLRVWQFPADAPAAGWQYGEGSLGGDESSSRSGGTATIAFNADAVGTMTGDVSPTGDAMSGAGGLGRWTKRSCIWTTTNLTTCAVSIAGCAAGCGFLHDHCGPNVCNARLPANAVGSFRNLLYTSADCSGAPAAAHDVRLGAGCAAYGSAGAVAGFNASSGNVSLRIFDGSDCPCGTYTPFNPQTGAGGECTCPASRCAVNASRVLRYPIRFGDDAAAAPCVAGVAPENAVACNGDRGSTPCKSQKWLLTPAPEDKVACQAVLGSGCSDAKKQGPAQCSACADAPATWNKLKYLACSSATVKAWCQA